MEQDNITILLILLSVLCLLEFISLMVLFTKYLNSKVLVKEYEEKVNSFSKKIKQNEENYLDAIMPGCKVHFRHGLSYKKQDFFVRFEADVLEVSADSVKISPYDFIPEGSIPNDLKNKSTYKSEVLQVVRNTWILKKDVCPIMSAEEIRNRRINKVLYIE
jgi:hypothetical protein